VCKACWWVSRRWPHGGSLDADCSVDRFALLASIVVSDEKEATGILASFVTLAQLSE